MIIWRGWGAIPLAIALLCVGVGFGMSSNFPQLRGVFVGLMLIGGGVATWFIGQHLNQKKPVEELESWHAKRRQRDRRTGAGRAILQRSRSASSGAGRRPWAVGEYVLNQESTRVRAVLINRHSLFFVPMQCIGFAMGFGGLVAMVTAVIPS